MIGLISGLIEGYSCLGPMRWSIVEWDFGMENVALKSGQSVGLGGGRCAIWGENLTEGV